MVTYSDHALILSRTPDISKAARDLFWQQAIAKGHWNGHKNGPVVPLEQAIVKSMQQGQVHQFIW
jgi:hypothetical protein